MYKETNASTGTVTRRHFSIQPPLHQQLHSLGQHTSSFKIVGQHINIPMSSNSTSANALSPESTLAAPQSSARTPAPPQWLTDTSATSTQVLQQSGTRHTAFTTSPVEL
ncbi:hypothetical protein PoB_005339400 [Plakobranchus ocellatus]|uniref:Uncharacterized protein n=1 Tax=Plakobranchus ocellatus TaxID=259542 RepID=A0AAV4C742_9GAST|nr:hypothetical protein PoB_005339400 [Plakobranchus ocellatus]